MDILRALFGSEPRIKLLRLFLFNPTVAFVPAELAMRTKCTRSQVGKECKLLLKTGILRTKKVVKEIAKKEGSTTVMKFRGTGYVLDEKFPYLEPLKNLLIVASVRADELLLKRLSGVGHLKLLIASGVFIQQWDSRLDLLIVGDNLNLNRIELMLRMIESEIGRELSYSAFETADFEYRLGIHDRLVRDVLDYPHVTLVDRIGIEPH